jgi:glycosyltransferase involved in cell wall biosynthesis
VLIEAMAAGVPVVATDAPGIRDVVRGGETGLLVPISSPSALAGAIRRLLEDESLRQSLTAAAFADVRRRFTWDIAVNAFRRVLEI